MRSLLVATGIVVFAAHVQAQSAPAAKPSAPATTSTAADTEPPALIKTVVDDPNDSPMVRAAKRAVASRRPGQRRVVSLNSSSTTTKGRFAVSTGPAEGPRLPPVPSDAKPLKTPSADDAAALQRAQVQERLKRLEAEERMLAAETDEPYGGDIEEDQVDKRLAEIEAERKKLRETPPPPPER